MTRLLHDRYLPLDDARACDLVTGEEVALNGLPIPNSQSDARANSQALEVGARNSWELGVDEVLSHGRDGEPRWIVADVRNAAQAGALARRAAADGQRRGFVTISVANYLRLREVLAAALVERTLLLVGGFTAAMPAAREALLDAAARAPRPHVLLTFRTQEHGGQPQLAREARTAYGAAPRRLRPEGPRILAPDVARYVEHVARAETFVRAGRHAAGERLLRESAGALERRRVFDLAASAQTALGRLLLERGRAADADGMFEAAARAAGAAQDEEAAVAARVWQASARCDAGRLTASEAIARAAVMASHRGGALRLWAQAALARVLVCQQRSDDLPELPLTGEERDALGTATAAFVDGVAVRTLLAGGALFDAGRRAREAVDGAAAAGDPLARAIALTAYLRVLCTVGDLAAARTTFDAVRDAARCAHAPLRVARARLVLHDALRRSGDRRGADAQVAFLRRVRAAAPPLLRHAIDRCGMAADVRSPEPTAIVRPAVVTSALVSLVHEEEDDLTAARKAMARLARELRAGRIELLSADAGPVSVLAGIGHGLPTHLGRRVLDAGITIVDRHEGGDEIGVSVRLGVRLLAALVARWPVDRTPPPSAGEALELAAAIIAARVDSALTAARATAAAATSVPELVGVSELMADVRRAIVRAAAAPFNVLIEGESGVGKELAARAIHQLGPRRERRFCDVNCAAIPEELLDSELFGHARGAFTGAVTDRAGLFEDADGGTLFLDEVADLSARGQAKLLRVLQQQEIRRVGETISRPVDVRLVTAANRDMRTEAAEARFRQDLLYRIDVIRIRMPPLRDRPQDVALLAEHFWRAAAARVGSAATLTHGVLGALTRYHWPGNVRELQNVMAALAVGAPPRGRVVPALLPPAIAGATSVTAVRLAEARTQFERRCLEVALARAAGNRSQAAAELGLSRQGLLKMMSRLGIEAK
jgi:DNA-binding NtrC family response regulator